MTVKTDVTITGLRLLYTARLKHKAMRLLMQGVSVREVSETFNINPTTVRVWARKAGVPLPKPQTGQDFTASEVDTIILLWSDPAITLNDIARTMNRTRNSIIGKIHRLGLPRRASPIRPQRLTPPKPASIPRGVPTLPVPECLKGIWDGSY